MNYHASRFEHARPARTAIVLVNLGTPEAPETGPVRRYLAEFLWDPRVIEIARPLWWLILNGVILRIRPRRSAAAYRRVWTERGSPLLDLSQRLVDKLGASLGGERGPLVRLAMRYGRPSIRDVLRELGDQGMTRLLVLPLYPQYSATTTASVFDGITEELRTWRRVPELRWINQYFDEGAYLDALADSVRRHRQQHGAAEQLLFSFHGIPKRYFDAGDPYFCHCQATARRVAERLGLPPNQYQVSFQSRVGREEWLRPYTDQLLESWPAKGMKSVQVVCPAFAVDCLETLEEIAMENRERFLHAGGERYEYIPALNDDDAHVAALRGLILRHAQGWPLEVDTAEAGERVRQREAFDRRSTP